MDVKPSVFPVQKRFRKIEQTPSLPSKDAGESTCVNMPKEEVEGSLQEEVVSTGMDRLRSIVRSQEATFKNQVALLHHLVERQRKLVLDCHDMEQLMRLTSAVYADIQGESRIRSCDTQSSKLDQKKRARS
jgi:hypothetical protein